MKFYVTFSIFRYVYIIEEYYIFTFPNFTYKVVVMQNLPAIGSVCSAKNIYVLSLLLHRRSGQKS